MVGVQAASTACRTTVQPNVNVVSTPVPIEIDIDASISSTSTPTHHPLEHPPIPNNTTAAVVSDHTHITTHHINNNHIITNNPSTSTLHQPLSSTSTTSATLPEIASLVHPPACRYATIEEVPNDILADTIALILEQFISRSKCNTTTNTAIDTSNIMLPQANEPAALFFSPSKQTDFTLSFYIRRLVQYTCCSKSAFVVAVLYLARLSQNHPIFVLSDLNVHRLTCTSIVLAAKWLDDISYSNSHYARVSGVQTAAEMTRMENHFLKAIDFRLYVAPNNYRDVENSLLNIAASWS